MRGGLIACSPAGSRLLLLAREARTPLGYCWWLCRLSKVEATAQDPQTRLLLQLTAEALSNAGGSRAIGLLYYNRAVPCDVRLWLNTAELPSAMRAGPAWDAGALAASTGTYVGCMFVDYMQLLRWAQGGWTSQHRADALVLLV